MDHIGAELIEEDSVAAPYAGATVAEHIPGKSEAWAKVGQVVVAKLAVFGHSGIAGEEYKRQRVRMHRGAAREIGNVGERVAVICLVPGKVWLPSNSEI